MILHMMAYIDLDFILPWTQCSSEEMREKLSVIEITLAKVTLILNAKTICMMFAMVIVGTGFLSCGHIGFYLNCISGIQV